MQEFVRNLRYRQQRVWREADGLGPREVNIRRSVASAGADAVCACKTECNGSLSYSFLYAQRLGQTRFMESK